MEFVIADRPRFRPGKTLTGEQPTKPVVDTGVELGSYGRIYLSQREVRVAMSKFRWPLPEQFAHLEAETAAAQARVAELEAEVARMRPVFDAVVAIPAFVGASWTETSASGSPPITWESIPAAAEDMCSATTKSGAPCKGKALPGRDVCLAHSKKAA